MRTEIDAGPETPHLTDVELREALAYAEARVGQRPWLAEFIRQYRAELAHREAARTRPDPPHRDPRSPRPSRPRAQAQLLKFTDPSSTPRGRRR